MSGLSGSEVPLKPLKARRHLLQPLEHLRQHDGHVLLRRPPRRVVWIRKRSADPRTLSLPAHYQALVTKHSKRGLEGAERDAVALGQLGLLRQAAAKRQLAGPDRSADVLSNLLERGLGVVGVDFSHVSEGIWISPLVQLGDIALTSLAKLANLSRVPLIAGSRNDEAPPGSGDQTRSRTGRTSNGDLDAVRA